MNPKCPGCPIPEGEPCYGLHVICQRIEEPKVRAMFIEYHAQAIASFAARLIAENPPDQSPVPIHRGGCCG
jgi:hypothetical protein